MKNNKGFTLIELLAVIIILGILALITVPIVSNYISNTRENTYIAHEATMKEAAKSLTVECINGAEGCDLPREGESSDVFLSELIDKSFSQRLQNPKGDGYCNENLSYVRITNTGNSNYSYTACLYCGNYVTEGENCAAIDTSGDTAPPICGAVEGTSSEWTNKARVISVGCTDTGSGCLRSRFTRTFTNTATDGKIEITDRAGNSTECNVSVKVDKTPPTCELEVIDFTEEANGWYSGPIKVRFKSGSINDSESGKNTWGIGTSADHPDYNRKELVDLTDINGVVTVFGYVKDNAGNEGTCSKNLRLGIQRPAFDIYYGYRIFPLKERYSMSGLTVQSDNIVKTSSTNPKLTFTSLSKFKNVTRVVITTNTTSYNPQDFRLKVDNGSEIKPNVYNSGKRIEFTIAKGSYNTFEFKFGATANKEYNIDRIEIQQTDNGIATSLPITVNLHPDLKREKVKTTRFSFNNGNNYQSDYFKSYEDNHSNNAKTANDVPMYSDAKSFQVRFVKVKPNIDTNNGLTQSPTTWTNGNVVLTGKATEANAGIIEFGFTKGSPLTYFQDGWTSITLTKSQITKTHTVETNGTYYFNVKSEAGVIANAHKDVTNIDKIKPVCSVSENSKITCTDSGSTDYGVSKINKYRYSKTNDKNGNYESVSETASLTVTPNISTSGTYYLYAKDVAGNISDVKSYTYYDVTYNCNGGTNPTKSSAVVRDTTPVDLSPTCTRTGYTFVGWAKTNNATSKLTSLNISSSNVTLYAIWTINNPGTPTISGGDTKIYNSGTITLTCTENTSYDSVTTKYYSFGYSSTDGGTPGNWTSATSSKTYVVAKDAFFGSRYYSCRVYAASSTHTSSTSTSSTNSDTLVRYKNATISFDANGGTAVINPSVSGTTPLYTRSGQSSLFTGDLNSTTAAVPGTDSSTHNFNGWYTGASNGSMIYNSSKSLQSTSVSGYISGGKFSLTENKTLYARWSPKTFTIIYDYNGGSAPRPMPSTLPTSYVYATGATISGAPATRSGYTFNGWIYGSTTAYTQTIGKTTYGNQTLTAKWCNNCNPGTSNASCSLSVATAGTCKYTTSCPAGYTISGNGTYNPSCTANTYTIVFNKNDPTATGSTANKTCTYDTDCELTANGFDLIGRNFSSWATSASGSGVYSNKQKVKNLTTTANGTVNLYAKWTPKTYSITYNYDSGSAPSSGVPGTYTYGTGATISGKPTRSGYTFNGWSFSSNLSSPAFTKSVGKADTGDKTLYAKWCQNCAPSGVATCTLDASTAGTCDYTTSVPEGYILENVGTPTPNSSPRTYTVTYNKGSGTGDDQTQLVTFKTNWTTKDAIFSKTGHTQVGWSTTNGGSKTHSLNTNQGAYSKAGDMTLYAVYSPVTYSITYNYNGGTAPSSGVPSSYTYGTGTTINGSPTLSNYTFNGWTWGSSTLFSHTVGTSQTGNISVSANWCQNCASVSNGTCSLDASTAGTCTYTTTCNTNYHHTSGQNTRAPVCAPDCPSGYTLQSNGTCVKTYTASSTYTCPSGGSLSGTTCTTTETYTATGTLTYSGGCSWVDDGCHGHFSTRNIQSGKDIGKKGENPTCDASNGYTGTVACSEINKYPASSVYYWHDCGAGKQGHAYASGTGYNCTSPKDRYTYKADVCACSGTSSTVYSCPRGGSLSNTTCTITGTYTATLSYYCNTGDSLSGTTCTSVVNPG